MSAATFEGRYDGEIRGAVRRGNEILAWGDRVLSISLPDGRVTVLERPKIPFAGAGCVFGSRFVAARADGALVWNGRYVIDTGIETPDAVPATIHGRDGILIVQKFMQVRFYEAPANPREPWPYRDVYSIYTPSRQAGLVLSDVDGDGRNDIFCGNYWIRCPEAFELPWRLFAINTWHETPDSATLRLAAPARGGLFVSQGDVAQNARVAWFEKPDDPRQLWIPHSLGEGLGLRRPRAMALAGDELIVGENAGADSRLFAFRTDDPQGRLIGRGPGFRVAIALDPDNAVTIGGGKITFWEIADTRRFR